MRITVVGAGVTGMTTALVAGEAGHEVEIVAQRPPRDTTSAVAGASWGPHLVDDPRVEAWAAEGLREFTHLADMDGSAVRMVSGIEADPQPDAIPAWARETADFRVCEPGEVPRQYRSAWYYTIPLIDMPRYLSYLEDRIARAGIELKLRRVRALAEVQGDIVVNCTGLGARDLIGDTQLHPIRGQMVETDNPGIDEFFLGNAIDGELTVIFPHPDHLVLGGIGEVDDWSLEPDPAVEAAILARCAAVDDRLAGLTVTGRRVGLRPGRPSVRLERDSSDPRIIHNYGHGGSGVTLSWGCAADVLKLIEQP